MMTLFYSPNACSRAAHIALEETGIPFERVRVSLKEGAQRRPEFLSVNPKGRVPALKTERGILTECPAILAFLAASFPDAGLGRMSDPFESADILGFNLYLASTIHVTFAHGTRPERYADDEAARQAMRAKVPDSLDTQFGLVEDKLSDGRPFVHGDRYTVSDPYLFTFAGWLWERELSEAKRFPHLRHHWERVGARPATARALAAEAAPA